MGEEDAQDLRDFAGDPENLSRAEFVYKKLWQGIQDGEFHSGQRLRESLTAPPSSSGTRWSYSYADAPSWSEYASRLASFSERVIDSGGRTVAVQPERQIVVALVAGLTCGFNAPGVQRASGRA